MLFVRISKQIGKMDQFLIDVIDIHNASCNSGKKKAKEST